MIHNEVNVPQRPKFAPLLSLSIDLELSINGDDQKLALRAIFGPTKTLIKLTTMTEFGEYPSLVVTEAGIGSNLSLGLWQEFEHSGCSRFGAELSICFGLDLRIQRTSLSGGSPQSTDNADDSSNCQRPGKNG